AVAEWQGGQAPLAAPTLQPVTIGPDHSSTFLPGPVQKMRGAARRWAAGRAAACRRRASEAPPSAVTLSCRRHRSITRPSLYIIPSRCIGHGPLGSCALASRDQSLPHWRSSWYSLACVRPLPLAAICAIGRLSVAHSTLSPTEPFLIRSLPIRQCPRACSSAWPGTSWCDIATTAAGSSRRVG